MTAWEKFLVTVQVIEGIDYSAGNHHHGDWDYVSIVLKSVRYRNTGCVYHFILSTSSQS